MPGPDDYEKRVQQERAAMTPEQRELAAKLDAKLAALCAKATEPRRGDIVDLHAPDPGPQKIVGEIRGGGHQETRSRRELIDASVFDLVGALLYYGRKEDEDLPRGSIEAAIAAGEISARDIVDMFERELRDRLPRELRGGPADDALVDTDAITQVDVDVSRGCDGRAAYMNGAAASERATVEMIALWLERQPWASVTETPPSVRAIASSIRARAWTAPEVAAAFMSQPDPENAVRATAELIARWVERDPPSYCNAYPSDLRAIADGIRAGDWRK